MTGVDATDLAAKKDFVALKAEVGKLEINKSRWTWWTC